METNNRESGQVSDACKCDSYNRIAYPEVLDGSCYSPTGDQCSWYSTCLNNTQACGGKRSTRAISPAREIGKRSIAKYTKQPVKNKIFSLVQTSGNNTDTSNGRIEENGMTKSRELYQKAFLKTKKIKSNDRNRRNSNNNNKNSQHYKIHFLEKLCSLQNSPQFSLETQRWIHEAHACLQLEMVALLRGIYGTQSSVCVAEADRIDQIFDSSRDCCLMRRQGCAFYEGTLYNMCAIPWDDLSDLILSYGVIEDRFSSVAKTLETSQESTKRTIDVLSMFWDVGLRNCKHQWNSLTPVSIGHNSDITFLLEVSLKINPLGDDVGTSTSAWIYSKDDKLDMITNVLCAFTRASDTARQSVGDSAINSSAVAFSGDIVSFSSAIKLTSNGLPKIMVLLKFGGFSKAGDVSRSTIFDRIISNVVKDGLYGFTKSLSATGTTIVSTVFIQIDEIKDCQNVHCTLKSSTRIMSDVNGTGEGYRSCVSVGNEDLQTSSSDRIFCSCLIKLFVHVFINFFLFILI